MQKKGRENDNNQVGCLTCLAIVPRLTTIDLLQQGTPLPNIWLNFLVSYNCHLSYEDLGDARDYDNA